MEGTGTMGPVGTVSGDAHSEEGRKKKPDNECDRKLRRKRKGNAKGLGARSKS